MKTRFIRLLGCILILSLNLNTGCAQKRERFESELNAGRCDEALTRLPENDPLIKLGDKTQQITGTAVSYAFVGANYTAQVLWDVVGGTTMFIGLCGPLIAVTMMAPSSGSTQMSCIPGDMGALSAPPLGRRSFEDTKTMRCPDLVGLSRSIRKVSACYESRGGEENRQKAIANLKAVEKSPDFFACLPEEERNQLKTQLAALYPQVD